MCLGHQKLAQQERKRVGLLIDYTLFDQLELADAWFSLNQYYDMFPVTLRQSPSLDGLDAIIVAKPDTAFSEEDKYKIDQFVMKGGKALFLLMPSISAKTVSAPKALRLLLPMSIALPTCFSATACVSTKILLKIWSVALWT
ncbi:MAG: hypothetical protein HC912_11715 [Saprospiraceae bacterium]|nr:hypothetical protein [Saprospiraceae bacterium]